MTCGTDRLRSMHPLPSSWTKSIAAQCKSRQLAGTGPCSFNGVPVDPTSNQGGFIELPEMQRRATEVAARRKELQHKRTSLADERTALVRDSQLRRRVHDFAARTHAVIDTLDDIQKQQLLRLVVLPAPLRPLVQFLPTARAVTASPRRFGSRRDELGVVAGMVAVSADRHGVALLNLEVRETRSCPS
jgi:hypothetical protein